MVFTLPSFASAYVGGASAYFASDRANLGDPLNDFRLQMCKLGASLASGDYAKPPTDAEIEKAR